jgi:hypothetical protein
MAKAKAEGKKVVKLNCQKGLDDTGKEVECSGFGTCTMGKSGRSFCVCDYGWTGAKCQFSEEEAKKHKDV